MVKSIAMKWQARADSNRGPRPSQRALITPDRWMADFEKIAIRDEVRPLILKENALKLFGLKV